MLINGANWRQGEFGDYEWRRMEGGTYLQVVNINPRRGKVAGKLAEMA
jgi:hypothetical protein